jgi:hypothetical protein
MQSLVEIAMRRLSCIALLLALAVSAEVSSLAQTSAGSGTSNKAIPPEPGWYEIPNTPLAPNCPSPSPGGNSGCAAVTSAWSGAVADTIGNRMIIWGGGHQDYYGNEVYSLNLGARPISMTRITEPSAFNNACTDAQSDGNPTSRHTYGGLAFMVNVNKMYAYSGGRANCGYADNDTWTFDLSTLKWQRQDPTAGGRLPAACAGCVSDYDANTGLVFLVDLAALWSYNPAKNEYRRLQVLSGMDYHLSGVIDPGRKLFFMMGGTGQLWAVDIRVGSRHVAQDWSRKVQGCEPLLHAPYPGLAYEPIRKRIVGWAGGGAVYLFDPDARACTAKTYQGGPGPAMSNGTHGRFRYFPDLGVFVVVNDWKQDAFTLRLP